MEPPLDLKPPLGGLDDCTSAPKDQAGADLAIGPPAVGGTFLRSDEAPALPSPEKPTRLDEETERRLRRLSRRGFASAVAAVVGGVLSWRWVVTRDNEGGLPWPLRRVLEWNERVSRGVFRPAGLSPQFPRSMARAPRVNGRIGLDQGIELAGWRLQVIGPDGPGSSRWFTLDQIKALPRADMTTELRCIEGWSEIVHWAGVRLRDLALTTGLAKRAGHLLDYAALKTPDGRYYVGLDMASALHPQTLLCYEMNGRPLTPAHGAPLRLVIPIKYGIKNLKQIGTIQFTDKRPADYWAERGYDWYAGH
jgi:hypothetical protein